MAYGTKHMTVDGVKLMGSNLFGTCSTSSSTSAKMVTLEGFDVLVSGVTIHVKFTYSQNGACSLTVGSTAARSVRRNNSSNAIWEAGAIVSFTYDGTYWQQNDFYDTSGAITYSLSKSGSTIYLNGSNGSQSSVTDDDTNTWQQNTKYNNGYVIYGSGDNNKCWKTDSNGNPGWRVPVVVERKSVSFSLSAGAYNTYYISASKSGYVCVGVVGFNVDSPNGATHKVSVWNCMYFSGDDQIHIQLTNNHTNAISGTFYVDVLYY